MSCASIHRRCRPKFAGLLARALAALGAEPDGPALQRLLVRLASGKGGTLGAAKAAAMADGLWRIGKAPPRKPR
jgi:hypothetical protein